MKAYISPDIPRGQPPNLSASNAPTNMNVPLELWNFAKGLPKAQRRKVIDALCSIFFDYTLPDDLPPAVLTALGGWDGRMICARKVSFTKRGMAEEEATSHPESCQTEKSKNFSEESLEKVPNFFEENFPSYSASAAETQKNIGTRSVQIEIESELSKSKSRSELSSEIPTREQVRRYVECCEIHEIDPDKFFNHYEKAGWKTKDGKSIDDWRGMIRQWQQYEGKFMNDEEKVVKDAQSKRELKLMGRDPMKGTWIYKGGRSGVDFLQGSESWTEDRAAAELRKLQEELEGQAQH
ncbi:hypothetical protein [Paratractidigestivibacter sp.]|uniref:hypothetical protein n=1 Tax=Paratractidigestivibacter sp. TaxID=2847316 RepID=UPI002ABD156D|nr:hypothetical protein [Paratractidigestivibacter sp.]